MKIQTDNLQDTTVKPTPRRQFYGRLSRSARLGILSVALLAAGALGVAALNHVVPRSPNRVKDVTGRLVWYVQDGRLKSDLRTLASMIEYIAASEPGYPTTAVPTNPPLAGIFASPSNKS